MQKLRTALWAAKPELLSCLRQKDYRKILGILARASSAYMRPRSDADLCMARPYDSSVARAYGTGYLNASFVFLPGSRFIACQHPKKKHYERFRRLIANARAALVISLVDQCLYLEESSLVTRKRVLYQGGLFLLDELYMMGTQVRVLRCVCWDDHSVMSVDCMEYLCDYVEAVERELGISDGLHEQSVAFAGGDGGEACEGPGSNASCNGKGSCETAGSGSDDARATEYRNKGDGCCIANCKIIHCKAGVGRTGTFIMYRILRRQEPVEGSVFIELLLQLRFFRPYMVENECQLQMLANRFIRKDCEAAK